MVSKLCAMVLKPCTQDAMMNSQGHHGMSLVTSAFQLSHVPPSQAGQNHVRYWGSPGSCLIPHCMALLQQGTVKEGHHDQGKFWHHQQPQESCFTVVCIRKSWVIFPPILIYSDLLIRTKFYGGRTSLIKNWTYSIPSPFLFLPISILPLWLQNQEFYWRFRKLQQSGDYRPTFKNTTSADFAPIYPQQHPGCKWVKQGYPRILTLHLPWTPLFRWLNPLPKWQKSSVSNPMHPLLHFVAYCFLTVAWEVAQNVEKQRAWPEHIIRP